MTYQDMKLNNICKQNYTQIPRGLRLSGLLTGLFLQLGWGHCSKQWQHLLFPSTLIVPLQARPLSANTEDEEHKNFSWFFSAADGALGCHTTRGRAAPPAPVCRREGSKRDDGVHPWQDHSVPGRALAPWHIPHWVEGPWALDFFLLNGLILPFPQITPAGVHSFTVNTPVLFPRCRKKTGKKHKVS